MKHKINLIWPTRGKSFCKTSLHLGMVLKKYTSKAEMKECKKTTQHLEKYSVDAQGSLLVFFHFCLVSVPFSGLLLIEKLLKLFS